MDILVAAVAVVAFAATVFVFAGTATRRRPERGRTVTEAEIEFAAEADPGGEEWLTVGAVATRLEVAEHDVTSLVERDAIPFYVIRGGNIYTAAHLRFRRSEIDAWTIG